MTIDSALMPFIQELTLAHMELAKQQRIANLIELAKLEVAFGPFTEDGKLCMEDNAKVWLITQAAESLGLPENPPDPIIMTQEYKKASE